MKHRADSRGSALDVAEVILRDLGPLDSLKLQKLVYYCQAWSLAWNDEPLFDERIEAWIHGPVVPELYQVHSGRSAATTVGGRPTALSARARTTISEVLRYYGDKSALALRRLTHDERPWRSARGELPDDVPSRATITHRSMATFYANRPCGGGSPCSDLSVFSAERVKQSKKEISAGKGIGLGALARALQASRPPNSR